MQITRNSLDTNPGPSDWFTGAVYLDTIAAPSNQSRTGAASVHFTPGARTAWHTHPHGQTIWVTEGVGLCQRDGGPIELIRPPPHHTHALLPELGGMGVGTTDFIRLLMGKLTFDRIRMPFAAFVQER